MKRHPNNPVPEKMVSSEKLLKNCSTEKLKQNAQNGNKNKIASSTDLHDEELKRIIQDIKLQRLRNNIKALEKETLQRMSEKLSAMVDGVLGELERFDDDKDDELFGGEVIREKRSRERDNVKKFISRASPLSELLEVQHLRSLYHMFIAALIIAVFSSILGDTLTDGWRSVRLGFRIVPQSFKGLMRVIEIWIPIFLITCSVYPLLAIWAHGRQMLTQAKSWNRWVWDRVWLIGFLSLIIFVGLFVAFAKGIDVAPASGAIILLEQTRLVMKMHAFVRSNVPRCSQENTSISMVLPSFFQYLYFLFAPTLVYRDQYPRTSHIRWRFVIGCLVEFFGAILMLCCIFDLFIIPEYKYFGIKPHTPNSLAASLSRTILPASLFFLCGFYLFLHAWLNIWAEILLFADRRFYGAWWNATSYGEYYRIWNSVVHDYLHAYIYKDVHELTGNRTAGKWAVFAVSAIVHEWIIGLMLGFCYPIMFAQFFGVGAGLGFVRAATGKSRIANIFFWCSLAYGLGLQISLYSMESFARINCPKPDETFIDYFIPRSWSCNGLDL